MKKEDFTNTVRANTTRSIKNEKSIKELKDTQDSKFKEIIENLDKLFFKDDFYDHERYVEENLKVLKKCVDPQRVEFIVKDWMSKNLNNIQSYLKDGEDFNINFTTEASRNLRSEFETTKFDTKMNNNTENDITFGKNNEFKLDKLNLKTEQTINPDDLKINLSNN